MGTWIIILPPVITIALAMMTRKVRLSLIAGIVSAASIATNFSIIDTAKMSVTKLWQMTELQSLSSWDSFWSNYSLFICIFLLALGAIIVLINQTGAAKSYSNMFKEKVKSKKDAESYSLLFSFLLFIDDYVSILTTGLIMKPLTDKFRVPRVKLAFLLDAMAASLCAISPISSWFAATIGPLRKTGVTDIVTKGTTIATDTFWVFLNTVPFTFYSIIIVASAIFIVRKQISFGLMKKHEKTAEESGNLFGGKSSPEKERRGLNEISCGNSCSIVDFAFPIVTLVVLVLGVLLYSGNFYLFGGTNPFTKALQDAEISIALFSSSTLTLIFSILYYVLRKKLRVSEIPSVIANGIKLMFPSVTILVLAWTFGEILKSDLQTGQYLAEVLVGLINIKLIPVMFFLASLLTAFTTGSAWGTMAIFIPIGIQMILSFMQISQPIAASSVPILFPLIGAIISGGIAGDHISPMSDTTIMSSTSAGANHIDHVQTQITYAVPVIIASAAAFLSAGLLMPYGRLISFSASAAIGITLSFTILKIRNCLTSK